MPKLISVVNQQQQCSFRQNIRKRFFFEFKSIKQKYELSSMVLVLDLVSAKIISTLFTVSELVSFGILFIQRLELIRKPLDHHAVYFISPSKKSVDSLLKDFSPQKKGQYRKAHVLFTSKLDKNLMIDISNSITFLKKLAKHSFKQFYCQLDIVSDNCVSFSIPYLHLAFSQESNHQKQTRYNISSRFIDLVAGFQPLNTVRIYYQLSSNRISERIALRVSKQIKGYLFSLVDAKSLTITHDAPDLTIFITDRSLDTITPLIHGYAYESLLYDLLGFSEEVKDGLNSNLLKGQIFQQFRYRHISHALTVLPQRIFELTDKISQIGNLEKEERVDLNQLKKQKQDLQIHLQFLHRLFKKFQQKDLTKIGELELSLSTGIDQEGNQTNSNQLFCQVVSIIKSNTSLSIKQRIRLAILVLICIKLSKEDYLTIINLFNEQEQIILKNVIVFGIKYDTKISKSTKSIDKLTMERARTRLKSNSMPSQRFTSGLEIVLPRLISFLKSDQTNSKKFMQQIVVSVEEGRGPKFDEKRLICFICGGLSQSQICCVKRNSQLSSVLLASDCIITPNQFVQSLSKINILNNEALN